MPNRYKITKDASGAWEVQPYGERYASLHSLWHVALLVATGTIVPLWKDVQVRPILAQDEEHCPDCGRRTETEVTNTAGGGGGFRVVCTFCDYEYSDGF